MQQLGLSTWGLIAVEGEEAEQFLQSQLSQSIVQMQSEQLRLAAFCNAKGRTLGSFFVFRNGPCFYLLCHRSTIPALVKRFTMFILRAKCKARDASEEYVLSWGMEATNTSSMSVQWQDASAQINIRTLDQRMLQVTLQPKEANTNQPLTDDSNGFQAALIQLGIPFISQATVEMFVPQAINFDLIGGIAFDKGCYPGQEVVARSHYLGKSKRRTALACVQTPLFDIQAGQDVWLLGKTNEPSGNVVCVGQTGSNTWLLLDANVDDLLNPTSQFELKQGEHHIVFSTTLPPYDIQSKGNRFADSPGYKT